MRLQVKMKTRRNIIMWYKKILNLIDFKFNWFPNINDILFQGAEELNRAVKSMKDTNSLLPQLRTFLTFLDSTLEAETNFKVIYLKYIKLDWIFFAITVLCITALTPEILWRIEAMAETGCLIVVKSRLVGRTFWLFTIYLRLYY